MEMIPEDVLINALCPVERAGLVMPEAFFQFLPDGSRVVHERTSGAGKMKDNLAHMGLDPVLKQINALPGAKRRDAS